jgi:uncharacterized membrane protein
MKSRKWVPVILLFLIFLPGGLSAGAPDTIDVLYLCRASTWSAERRDLILSADPSISVLGVETVGAFAIWQGTIDPASVNRRLRIYMPRSYKQLLEERDLVILHDAPHSHPEQPEVRLDLRWLNWWVRAVKEEGMSLSMWGGDASWGGQGEQNNPSWGETIIESILPFECLPAYNPSIPKPLRPDFTDPDHPLATLPWDSSPPMMVLNNVAIKPGAELVAQAVLGRENYPWLAWWIQEKGRVVGETQVFSSIGGGARMRQEWDWWQDFIIYLAYFGAGKSIPEDIYRAHRIREEILTHISKASLMVSLLEFIEKFGISTVELYAEMDSITDLKEQAEGFYRQDDYDGAADLFEEINAAWNELNVKAISVKENALVWVYLIEWLVVTSVAILSGGLIWTLMVRRRFYREIATTRTGR